ncbi:MAG: hypothetical protein V2A73_20160, partial [Pseudomonadota bacterium]
AAGECQSGPALSCDDENPCTIDSCDADLGCAHVEVADTTPCSSATICGGVCAGGKCTGGVAVACDDENPCTADSCDPATSQCVNVATGEGTACDDGDACTTSDVCTAGRCAGTLPPDCSRDAAAAAMDAGNSGAGDGGHADEADVSSGGCSCEVGRGRHGTGTDSPTIIVLAIAARLACRRRMWRSEHQ